jgi:hypothetical protein
MTLTEWVESDDALFVWSETNGHGRGDGYDVDCYRSRRTGRYLVRVWEVGASGTSLYVATTREGADAVREAGYTPGGAPGEYEYISREERCALSELRGE